MEVIVSWLLALRTIDASTHKKMKEEDGAGSRANTHKPLSETEALGDVVENYLTDQQKPKHRQSVRGQRIRTVYAMCTLVILIRHHLGSATTSFRANGENECDEV